MNTNNEIEKFFQGRIDKQSILALYSEIHSDEAGLAEFKSNAILESQILDCCINQPSIKGCDDIEEWIDLISNALGRTFVPNVDNEIASVFNRENEKEKTPLLRLIRWSSVYKVAALFVFCCLSIGIFMYLQNKNSISQKRIVQTEINEHRKNDTIGIKKESMAEIETDSSKKMLVIGKKTSGIIDKQTKVQYAKVDTSVILNVTSGSILFNVEKGKYKRFEVLTPNARINVTGTVFRVEIRNNSTRVTVIEGSVVVENTVDKSLINLQDGNIAIANKDTLIFFETDSIMHSSIPERKLLSAFVNSHRLLSDDLISDSVLLQKENRDQKFKRIYNSKLKQIDSVCADADVRFGLYPAGKDSFRKYSLLKKYVSMLRKENYTDMSEKIEQLLPFDNDLLNENMLYLRILLSLRENNERKADSLLFEKNSLLNSDSHYELLMYVADFYREKENYERAELWYEYVFDTSKNEKYRDDAAYLMNYCSIQIRLKTKKAAAFQKIKMHDSW
jgi:hypothetical protein